MSGFEFGDMVDEDSADTAEPDPLATARIYQNYRSYVYAEAAFDELSDPDRALLELIFGPIIKVHFGLTPHSGAMTIVTLARYFSGNHVIKPWNLLPRKIKRKEIASAGYILKRLARETGIPWERD